MQILHPVIVRIEINSLLSFLTTIISPFLRMHCTGLTLSLSAIRYITSASSHLIISFFKTSLSWGSIASETEWSPFDLLPPRFYAYNRTRISLECLLGSILLPSCGILAYSIMPFPLHHSSGRR